MGASAFRTYHDGRDVEAAFHTAVDKATFDHGHSGYTGTIAEKDNFVIISRRPVSYDQALHLADDLLANHDPRIVDKWGPAGAIAVHQAGTHDDRDPDGWLFVGFASC